MKQWINEYFGPIVFLSFLSIIGITLFLTVRINLRRNQEAPAQELYNLQHPQIVGTNESGQVIKRYYLPTVQHFIYSLGDTVTVNYETTSGKTKTKHVEVYGNQNP